MILARARACRCLRPSWRYRHDADARAFVKPQSAIAMSFSDDPQMDWFATASPIATATLATHSFVMRTALRVVLSAHPVLLPSASRRVRPEDPP